MTRKERAELRKQQDRADKLIYDVGVFYHYFKDKPIGFDTLHVYTLARNFSAALSEYRERIEVRLAYKKRGRK